MGYEQVSLLIAYIAVKEVSVHYAIFFLKILEAISINHRTTDRLGLYVRTHLNVFFMLNSSFAL